MMNKFGSQVSPQRRPKPVLSRAGAPAEARVEGFKLGACRRCGGDASFDPADAGEWRCLQCARPVSTGASHSREVMRSLVEARKNRQAFAH